MIHILPVSRIAPLLNATIRQMPSTAPGMT